MRLSHFAVIGHPIGHTMSPFIHNRLFAHAGISPRYDVLDVPDIAQQLETLRALDGFNITIPHKSAIIPFLDAIDEKARLFGSVNTVKAENGRLTGYTTDGIGCRKALARFGLDFSGRLLILGRGGAAHAIAFEAVLSADAPAIDFACRAESADKARALCAELSALCERQGKRGAFRVLSYAQLEAEDTRYDLVLNTTSVGMYPNAGRSAVDARVLARCAAAFDAVYNPGETEFLRLAGENGLKTVGGMGMLVCQAVAAHEIWYGAAFADADIERLILDAEAETERLFGAEKGNA
ncbi:MAG: shikimate dehydrogenase [Hominenteromicrobium sp.]